MEKMLLIDGHNLLFRMFYGFATSIKNRQGKEIKGAFGFISSLKKMVENFNPTKIVVVFDTETSIASRLSEDSEYKQNRPDYSNLSEEENPFSQLPYIYQALKHLGIPYILAKEYEADDYIASISEAFKDRYQIYIVSTDKDFLQLVSDNVLVFNPMAKAIYTPEMVYEKWSITPEQVIDYKILVGDQSDNIKGIPQIGPKTAIKILTVGTIDEIINQEKQVETKLFQKIMSSIEIINKNRLLITMNRSIELESNLFSHSKPSVALKPLDILRECGVY